MSTTFTPSVFAKATTERPWIKKQGRRNSSIYRVVPRFVGHGKYELTVGWGDGIPYIESCVDYRTGEECLGFKYSRGGCYHAVSLLLKLTPPRKGAA